MRLLVILFCTVLSTISWSITQQTYEQAINILKNEMQSLPEHKADADMGGAAASMTLLKGFLPGSYISGSTDGLCRKKQYIKNTQMKTEELINIIRMCRQHFPDWTLYPYDNLN